MNVLMVFGAALLILFILAYLTKRRFGVLGLALAAGSMMSDLWAQTLTPIVAEVGVKVSVPPLITLVSIILVLLPAVVLLFGGPSYKHTGERLIGAALFAALAFALLVEPLGSALSLDGSSLELYKFFYDYRVYIITAGLIVALVDILFTRTSKHHKRSTH